MSQLAIARRHAPSLVIPTLGGPSIRSVPSLGWEKVRIRGRVDVEEDASEDARKKRVYWGVKRFIRWMEAQEGARFAGDVSVHGPFPHFDAHGPDVQVGDRGGSRMVARSISADCANTGKVDYVIEATFLVPERIQEVRTDVALDLFKKGKPGVRPVRERELRWLKRQ